MQNFRALACLEVPEKCVWGVGWSFSCQNQSLWCVAVRVRVGVGVLTTVSEILKG